MNERERIAEAVMDKQKATVAVRDNVSPEPVADTPEFSATLLLPPWFTINELLDVEEKLREAIYATTDRDVYVRCRRAPPPEAQEQVRLLSAKERKDLDAAMLADGVLEAMARDPEAQKHEAYCPRCGFNPQCAGCGQELTAVPEAHGGTGSVVRPTGSNVTQEMQAAIGCGPWVPTTTGTGSAAGDTMEPGEYQAAFEAEVRANPAKHLMGVEQALLPRGVLTHGMRVVFRIAREAMVAAGDVETLVRRVRTETLDAMRAFHGAPLGAIKDAVETMTGNLLAALRAQQPTKAVDTLIGHCVNLAAAMDTEDEHNPYGPYHAAAQDLRAVAAALRTPLEGR